MDGPKAGKTATLTSDNFTVGRGEECDLLVDQDGISRMHCRITKEGDDYYVADTQSTNGVYINGHKLEGRHKLKSNDNIRLGSQHFLFTSEADLIESAFLKKDDAKKLAPEPQPEPETSAQPKRRKRRRRPSPVVEFLTSSTGVMSMVVGALLIALIYVIVTENDDNGAENEEAGIEQLAVSEPKPETMPSPDEAIRNRLREKTEGRNLEAVSHEDVKIEPEDPSLIDTETGTKTQPKKAEPPPEVKPTLSLEGKTLLRKHLFRSEPAGATILLDNQEIGTTPFVLDEVKEGTHQLMLRKPGFQERSVLLKIPNKGKPLVHELKPVNGTIMLESTPTNATVLYGSQVLGQTPFLLHGSEWEGRELTVAASGYLSQKTVVRFSLLKPKSEHVELQPYGGQLKLVTMPANGTVYFNGRAKGTVTGPKRGQSTPYVLEGLRPGIHKVYVQFPDGTRTRQAKVKIHRGRTSKIHLVVYKPDTEVIIRGKKIVKGMLRSESDAGDVTLVTGPKESVTIKKDDIILIRPLESMQMGTDR